MKKSLHLLLAFIILFSVKVSAQFSPDNTFGQNPATGIVYTDVSGGSSLNWTVTNGTIVSFTGTTANVTWADDYNASTGTLTHTIPNGSNPATINTVTYKIKALKNFTPGAMSGPLTVNYCSTSTVTYSVPQVNYSYGGGTTPIDGYEWTIPMGWKYPDGVVSNGTTVKNIPGLYNGLVLMPDGCHAGAVKVRGYTYTGSAYVSYSNYQQTSVGLNNNLSVSGPTTVVCGSTAPLVYTLANGSCASAISWTLPPGWTGTSTTTSITVTPTATNVGDKTVTANVTLCGGTILHPAISVTPQLFAPGLKPAVSGAATICTGINQTYSITNPASGTILWTVTGTGATIVGPNNGPTVTLQYATNGGATLGATITSPCQDNTGNSAIVLDNFPICTGVPYPNPSTTGGVTICTQGLAGHLNIITNSCATAYTTYSNSTVIEPYHLNPDYNSSIPVSSGDHRAYQYIVGGAGSSKTFTSDAAPGTYQLALYASNDCGYSGRSNVIVTVKTCGGRNRESFAIFPNPSSSQLNVAYTPEETDAVQAKQASSKTASITVKGYFVELLNDKGKVVAKGWTNSEGKLSLDVSRLPKNTYYVHIHHGDELIRKQFIVN